MTAMAIDRPVAAAVAPEILEVAGEEILTEFAKVMLEWGHHKTAKGLCFPEPWEARLAGLGRRADVGRNRRPDGTWNPIPDGRPLFVTYQVRVLPPADPARERGGGRRPAVRVVLHQDGAGRRGVDLRGVRRAVPGRRHGPGGAVPVLLPYHRAC